MPTSMPSSLTLVLKFANKGVFFEEIQDSHFPRKRGILVLTSVNLEKRGLILMCSVYCEKGVYLGWKVSVLPQKRGFILDWKVSVLSWKGGCFELKSQVFCCKKEVIFKLKNKDGYHFFQWVRELGFYVCPFKTVWHQLTRYSNAS